MAEFEVLTDSTVADLRARGQVDTDDLKQQLMQIKDSLDDLVKSSGGSLPLKRLEVALTLSAQGKVLFISTATATASITLTFERP